jgi:predicted transcriptional regulator
MKEREELPTLTRAEAEVMQALWPRGRATVHEIVEAMERPVAYTTVLTLLRILEKKGYVLHEPDPAGGRAYIYVPAVAQGKARRQHVHDLIQRMFSGSTEELLAGLVEEERLSPATLEALRAKIDERLGARREAPRPTKKKGSRDA